MNAAIEQMLKNYQVENLYDQKNAMKEIMQEIVLCGLSRAGFFREAALRIFYGLDRFSEDLDFSLMTANPDFDLAAYFPTLEKEVRSFGLNVTNQEKKKTKESNIQSAFLKGNTKEHLLLFYPQEQILGGIAKSETVKIKFEVDAVSVILSLVVIRKTPLPFDVSAKLIRFHDGFSSKILKAGIPLAFQDLLTNLSFVVINSVANQLGPDATAWAGIASGYSVDNKLTVFTMIIPTAFLQSMAVFTAQNVGAGNRERIQKGLRYMLMSAVCVGVVLALLCEFGGSVMARIFTNDTETIYYAAQYLKGYAVDCLICTSMLTLLGYFNGCGHSTFVLIQGLIGSFVVRIPVILLLQNYDGVTLTHLGLGCASATVASLLICIGYYLVKTKSDTMFPSHMQLTSQ